MEINKMHSMDLNIAGKTYPVRVQENEIPLVEKIEKELNTKINDCKLQYKDIDQLDSITMVLISYAFDNTKNAAVQERKVGQKLEILEQLVESNL